MFLNVCFLQPRVQNPKISLKIQKLKTGKSLFPQEIFCKFTYHLTSYQEMTHFNKILNQNKSKLSTKITKINSKGFFSNLPNLSNELKLYQSYV